MIKFFVRNPVGCLWTIIIMTGSLWLLGWGCVEYQISRRDRPECPEDGRLRSHSEIFSAALRAGVREGVFGPSIQSPEDLIARDPDCCFLNSRGDVDDGFFGSYEPYVSTIYVYVDIREESVPERERDSLYPIYRRSILVSRCGEFRGSWGRAVSLEDPASARSMQIREFGDVRYEK